MYDTHLQFEQLDICAVLAVVEIIGIPLFTVHLFRDATPTTPGPWVSRWVAASHSDGNSGLGDRWPAIVESNTFPIRA